MTLGGALRLISVVAVLIYGCYWGLSTAAARIDEAGERAMIDSTWQQYCTQLLAQRGYAVLWSSQGCRNTPIEYGGQLLLLPRD